MRALSISLISLGLTSLMQPQVLAQPGPSPVVNTWSLGTPAGSGTGNWNVAGNWSANAIPNVANEDAAAINGGGTAQINTVIANNVGSVVLGQGLVANEPGGTLEIQSGGSLTAFDDPTFPADGSVRVGQNVGQGTLAGGTGTNPQAGTGRLRVLPGGTLTSVSLSLGGTVNSSITLGGTGAGTTTVNTGLVTLGRTMRVIGPNVNFTSSGTGAAINFQGNSIFIPEITGANHSVLKTTGTAALGGTLQVDFNGVTPAVNQSWNLIDAANVTGGFAAHLPDAGVPLGSGQVIATRTANGGTNGRLVQMFVQQLPVLTVDRTTGAVSITNPGTTGVPLDGYTIESAAGSLNMANWQSLEDTDIAGPDWFESNPTANRLSELRSVGTSTLAGGSGWSLGNIFRAATPTQIGQNVEDLVVQYNDPVTQSTVTGVINYSGPSVINNLVLYADPATGNVKIRNTSPLTVQIDGYTITSAGNSLNSNPASWTSLQDQPGVAPNWFEANVSDGRVSEVMSGGVTTLTGNSVTTFDLGGLFKTAGAQDLQFQFLLAGNANPNNGVVIYGPAPPVGGLTGDYNASGAVDAADYVLWRNGGPLQNDSTPGTVDQSDYQVWRANFGRTTAAAAAVGGALAGSAVPEPATLWFLAVIGLALAGARFRLS